MSESRVQKFTTLQMACLVMSIVSLVGGCLGIVLSFLYLASYGMADITAGASGIVAGSIFIGSGLLALTLVSVRADS